MFRKMDFRILLYFGKRRDLALGNFNDKMKKIICENKIFISFFTACQCEKVILMIICEGNTEDNELWWIQWVFFIMKSCNNYV